MLVVGGEDHGFGRRVVGRAAWVLAPVLLAAPALEAPLAVLGMTVTDEMFAATMGAAEGGCKQRLISPRQNNLSHYHILVVAQFGTVRVVCPINCSALTALWSGETFRTKRPQQKFPNSPVRR